MGIRISDAFKSADQPNRKPKSEDETAKKEAGAPSEPVGSEKQEKAGAPSEPVAPPPATRPKMHFLDPGGFSSKPHVSPGMSSPALERTPEKNKTEESIVPERERNAVKVLDSLYRQILLNFREMWWTVAGGGSVDKEHYLFFHTQLNLLSQVIGEFPELVTAVIFRARRPETYLIAHSVNVGFLAVALSLMRGFTREMIVTTGLGGIFHDIGMARIPENVYLHPAPLSASELKEVQRHPLTGGELLRETQFVCEEAIVITENSHESLDGSGYPRGLTNDEIPEIARMVRVVDAFDTLVQPRPYRPPLTQHAALMQLIKDRTMVCQQSLKALIDSLTFYPVGSIVRMDSGELAVVRKSNRLQPTRPKIEVFVGTNGRRFPQPRVVDLSCTDFYTIRDVLTPDEAEVYIKRKLEIAASKEKEREQ